MEWQRCEGKTRGQGQANTEAAERARNKKCSKQTDLPGAVVAVVPNVFVLQPRVVARVQQPVPAISSEKQLKTHPKMWAGESLNSRAASAVDPPPDATRNANLATSTCDLSNVHVDMGSGKRRREERGEEMRSEGEEEERRGEERR